MKRYDKTSMFRMTFLAIVTAMIVLLQMIGSFIHFGPFSVSLVLLPIIVGVAYCGVFSGVWLGFVFGLVVLISGDAGAFFAINPFGTVFTVLVKGMLCGLAAGAAFHLLRNLNRYFAIVVAAIVCPVVNTGVFLLCSRVFFYDALIDWADGENMNVVVYMFVGLVGANFLFELGTNLILSPVIMRLINIFRISDGRVKATHPVFYISGSPCSGKSTVAEYLSAVHGLTYFKVDDRLDEYMARGAAEGKPVCRLLSSLSPEENFMRDPAEQCRDELGYYRETFNYSAAEIGKLAQSAPVIAEGAAFLPELLKKSGVKVTHCVVIVPSVEFQSEQYAAREWAKKMISEFADPEEAFARWMKRDNLFAEEILREGKESGYRTIVNDGSMTVEELIATVSDALGFQKKN